MIKWIIFIGILFWVFTFFTICVVAEFLYRLIWDFSIRKNNSYKQGYEVFKAIVYG